MAQYQQLASSAAEGTGRLRAVLELTKALQDINDIESKARTRCFTKFHHTTDTHKWSFDSVKDGAFFDELHKGQTRFTIKIADTSGTSYNIRLLKMYVELYGDDSQGEGFPAKVYLNLRHMAASYFRDESDTGLLFSVWIKATVAFNRCAVHYLSDLPCDADIQLGAQECQSPFGTYEFSIPIDKTLACDSSTVTDQILQRLDRTKFTKMNVWVSYLYCSGAYPTGPDDARCNKLQSPSSKSKVRWPKPQLILKHKPKHQKE
ncbi:hypothetical protein OS493_020157 [Desmophyllum pertusum]|uniref:Uncharacterized protein n=1 Tax=Desmophyllum pertusum TaxID=174260 RepID=A0A9X0A0B5_9CNID|nr:hypothetical protein OS493_020157 [Desmophyllum pertusum]